MFGLWAARRSSTFVRLHRADRAAVGYALRGGLDDLDAEAIRPGAVAARSASSRWACSKAARTSSSHAAGSARTCPAPRPAEAARTWRSGAGRARRPGRWRRSTVGVTSAPPARTFGGRCTKICQVSADACRANHSRPILRPDVVERLGLPAVVDHQGGAGGEPLDRHVDRRERVAGRVVDLEHVDVVGPRRLGGVEPGRRAGG